MPLAAPAPAPRADGAPLRIRVDDLRGPAIHALLEEHLRQMRELSPPESVHALDLNALRRPEITFWTAWAGDTLMGCGALKLIDAGHGEIKSMRTAAAARRQGVARQMLAHIMADAQARGLRRLSLETGAQPGFAAARALYAGFGFVACGPFASYREDANSVFMTRALDRVAD
jgi:putative acetyltransferase